MYSIKKYGMDVLCSLFSADSYVMRKKRASETNQRECFDIGRGFQRCGIQSLAGIEVFGNLIELQCMDNELATFDVTGLPNFEKFWCDNNRLTSLDLSGASSLEYLSCGNNRLASLDVRGLSNLKDIYCDCEICE